MSNETPAMADTDTPKGSSFVSAFTKGLRRSIRDNAAAKLNLEQPMSTTDTPKAEPNQCPVSFRHLPHDACDGKPDASPFADVLGGPKNKAKVEPMTGKECIDLLSACVLVRDHADCLPIDTAPVIATIAALTERLAAIEKASPEVERLRGLLEKATPRPWQVSDEYSGPVIDTPNESSCPGVVIAVIHNEDSPDMDDESRNGCKEENLANASLIVESVHALPALLDAHAAAAAALKEISERPISIGYRDCECLDCELTIDIAKDYFKAKDHPHAP